MNLLIATHNTGKRQEYQNIFEGLPFDLMMLDDAGITTDVPETGDTFTQNALIKARAYASMGGLPTLADDSGLAVDALEGFPGVYSARWAGPTDADRYEALLEKMSDVPWTGRQAQFVCVVALVLPDGREFTEQGTVDGRILFAPRGNGGFGYDPIFYVEEAGCTMAELSREEKNSLSHRGRAAQALRPVLEQIASKRA